MPQLLNLPHTQTLLLEITKEKESNAEAVAAHKPYAGELVVGWVTISESSLLYFFLFLLFRYTYI